MCSLLPQITLILLIHYHHCLNIDTQFPITFNYPGRIVPGRPGDSNRNPSPHFGHSVLVFKSGPLNSGDSTIFLIGAPNESIERNESGSLYRCEWREKLDRTSCYRVQINFDYRSGPTERMHLGSNLLALAPKITSSSTQTNYVSCAYARSSQHNIFRPSINRYEMNYNPNGACWELQLDKPKPIASIMPMNDGAQQFKSHNSTTSVYYYSHAMAGFSAAFSQSGRRLYLGAPGFDNWKGALLAVPETDRLQGERSAIIGKIDDSRSTSGDSSLLDEEFAYLGYSVAIGRFFQDRKIEYAAVGAPRVSFKGLVAIFRLEEKDVEYDRNKKVSENQKLPVLQLVGKQKGEYFGASLLSVDVNGDGFEDLLVGAPMYCSPAKKDVSDEGRVYVYLSSGQKMVHRQMLYGSKQSDGRFGTAMAAPGDLNHDGFNDVVIGAPYEDNGQGAIYLYRGGPEGLVTNFSQRISASELADSLNLRRFAFGGFGFSFSPGAAVDVDENGFNDLLVGSYLSNNAVLLRTRPIISLSAFIRLSESSIDLSSKCKLSAFPAKTSKAACIGLQLCFDTANFEAGNRVRLRTTLNVDALLPSSERCYLLLENGQQRSTSVIGTVDLVKSSPDKPICSPSYIVQMEESTKIENYLAPVLFTMRYELAETKELTRDNIYFLPVVEGATVNITAEAYLRACGSKAAKDCISSLQLRPFVVLDEEEEREAVAASEVIELIEGLHRKVRLQLMVTNFGEPAFDVKVNLTLNSTQLSLISLDPRCNLQAKNTSTNIECYLGSGPLSSDQPVTPLELTFNPFSDYKVVSWTAVISAANKIDAGTSHLVESFSFRRVKRAGISLKVLESPPAIRYKADAINASFESLLTLERLNYSTIDLLELHFLYPSTVGFSSRHLLARPLLITNLNNRIPLRCDAEKDYNFVQEDQTFTNNQLPLKAERAISKSGKSKTNQRTSTKSLQLNCDPKNPLKIQCRAIRCRLGPMSWAALSAYVKFSSHLLVGSIEELYGASHLFDQIVYKVSLMATIVDEHLSTATGSSTTSMASVSLTFKAVDQVVDEPAAWWIYLVGILIGLLLIALLILLLWKCGFFKRKGAANLVENEEE